MTRTSIAKILDEFPRPDANANIRVEFAELNNLTKMLTSKRIYLLPQMETKDDMRNQITHRRGTTLQRMVSSMSFLIVIRHGLRFHGLLKPRLFWSVLTRQFYVILVISFAETGQ